MQSLKLSQSMKLSECEMENKYSSLMFIPCALSLLFITLVPRVHYPTVVVAVPLWPLRCPCGPMSSRREHRGSWRLQRKPLGMVILLFPFNGCY